VVVRGVALLTEVINTSPLALRPVGKGEPWWAWTWVARLAGGIETEDNGVTKTWRFPGSEIIRPEAGASLGVVELPLFTVTLEDPATVTLHICLCCIADTRSGKFYST